MDHSFRDEIGVSAPAWDYVKRLNAPVRNSRGTPCHHICTLCIEDGRPFHECILRVYFKENKKGEGVPRSARANKHLERRHPDVWSRILNPNKLSSSAANNGKRKQTQSSKHQRGKRRSAASSSIDSNLHRISNSTIHDTHVSFVRMILKNRIPLYTCGTNASTSFLRSVYKNSYSTLESEKRDLILDVLFARMILVIQEKIREAREYFRGNGTSSIASSCVSSRFLTVVHSKWELNPDSNSYGIGLRWINPKSRFQLNNIALGIIEGCPQSLSVQDAVKSAGDIIRKVGVTEDDIMQSFVTNHSEAYPNTEMNIVQHILLQVILYFEAELLEEARELISFISQSPFWDMKIRLQYRNQESISGIFEMIRLLLLSHHCINNFFNQGIMANIAEKQNLSDSKWQKLAEMEAIMRPVVELHMDTKNFMPTISMAWLHIKKVQHLYAKNEYEVVNMFEASYEWDPSEAFDKLPTKLVSIGEGDSPASNIQSGFEPNNAQLIAMLCDPIVMTAGRLVLKSNSNVWEIAQSIFKEVVENEASSFSGRHTAIEMQQTDDHMIAEGNDMVIDDYLSQLRTAATEREFTTSATSSDTSRISDELNQWFSIRNIDWEEEYYVQNPSLGRKKYRREQLFDRKRLDCPYYLYEKINPLEWWAKAKNKYPIIHRIAAKYLAIPVENFSHFFTSLQFSPAYKPTQLGYPKYEHVVVQSFNSEWLEITDKEKDNSSLRNALIKGKRSQMEKYVEILYKFQGKAAMDSNGMQTEMFIKDVQAFIERATSNTARSTS